jgi:hypothetical protein
MRSATATSARARSPSLSSATANRPSPLVAGDQGEQAVDAVAAHPTGG